jgi:hypothetical protein
MYTAARVQPAWSPFQDFDPWDTKPVRFYNLLLGILVYPRPQTIPECRVDTAEYFHHGSNRSIRSGEFH